MLMIMMSLSITYHGSYVLKVLDRGEICTCLRNLFFLTHVNHFLMLLTEQRCESREILTHRIGMRRTSVCTTRS